MGCDTFFLSYGYIIQPVLLLLLSFCVLHSNCMASIAMSMKRITLILAFIAVCVSSFSQMKDEEKERERIARNRIAKCTQWTHKYAKNKPAPSGYITTETKYDKNGNPVEVVNYKSTGQVSSKLLYKYDKNNMKVEYVKWEKKDKPEIEITFKQNISYDEKGNKKMETGFDGVTTYRIVYGYLPDGRQREIVKYNADNSIAEKWEYSYTNSAQTISVYKPANNLEKKIVRKTDSDGNLLEEEYFTASGKPLKKTKSEYDNQHRVVTMSEYYAGKLERTLQYKYNANNQLAEIVQTNPDGSKFTHSIYKYDAKGNLTDEKWFDGEPNDLSSKVYRLDDKGNVLEVDSYYSDYKYKVLYKYTYETF